MDREQVVKLLRDIQNSPGFYNDIAKKDVILNYCVEHDKSPQLSIQFVQIVSINRVLLNEIFLDTLEMLKKSMLLIRYMHHRIPLIEEITQFY